MAMGTSFDAIVIGAGQAGPPLAQRLAQAGMSVAMIERKLVGGTCVNTGCIPTKALVASAYAAHLARRAADYGVAIEGAVRIDFGRVMQRANDIAANARASVRKQLDSIENCTLIEGHARFVDSSTVCVGDRELTAPKIFLDVGARAKIPDIPGVSAVPTLTNSSILELRELPKHLIVIGGSYVGLEFAQMFRRFGSEVTIVEQGPRLIGREDPDISAQLREILAQEGIAIRTNAECIRLTKHERGIAVGLDCDSGEPEVVGSHVLLAVGRTPNTDDLDLDKAGVELDSKGYIRVDESLATNIPGIWALGECNGRGAFTHTAYNHYEIVAANLLDGDTRRVSDRILAYALYTDPPLGRVGMTLEQARKSGRSVLFATRPMARVGRAIERGETLGTMQIVVDAQSHEILGAAILGTSGDEAIHGVIDMMNAEAPFTTLQWAVPIHPTVSELLPTLLGELREPPSA
jgi:pyruvate/2-oxoglutarate dehydrogenase complex dihydrolipoamide dehydrogenase (E3) component